VGAEEKTSLDSILSLPEGIEKTAALAAWFQGIYPPAAGVPVLVGGAAVEILSGGAYTTGDLDFVGVVPPEVARRLEAAGFSRQGRHWVHEEGQVFVELPGAGLDPDERAVFTQVAGWTVLILSPEDVLVDRLAAWQFWKSPMDAVAAFWVWQSMVGRLDTSHLRAAAERKGVEPALKRLRELTEKVAGRTPDTEELFAWARKTP
jgi:hypothetical protein